VHDTQSSKSMSKAMTLDVMGTEENPFFEPEASAMLGPGPGKPVACMLW
jgi:hypothetical protein